jgi:hypothetical protein
MIVTRSRARRRQRHLPAIQPNGGIVALAAYCANGTGPEQAVLVRLNP